MKYLIKDAAAKVGLPTHTIRYYEQEGLLPFVKRDENGNRIFDEEDVKWLEFIVCLRNTDIALSDLRKIVELTQEGEETLPQRKQIFEKHKEKMMKKQKDFDIAFRKIDSKIEYYNNLEMKYEEEKESANK